MELDRAFLNQSLLSPYNESEEKTSLPEISSDSIVHHPIASHDMKRVRISDTGNSSLLLDPEVRPISPLYDAELQ